MALGYLVHYYPVLIIPSLRSLWGPYACIRCSMEPMTPLLHLWNIFSASGGSASPTTQRVDYSSPLEYQGVALPWTSLQNMLAILEYNKHIFPVLSRIQSHLQQKTRSLASSWQWKTWDSHVVSSAPALLPGETVTVRCDYIASPASAPLSGTLSTRP